MVTGGWEVHETISSENMDVWHAVSPSLTNAQYLPLAVATQSIGGKNVCFICKTTQATGKEYFAKVLIRIPYGGEPELQAAKEILL